MASLRKPQEIFFARDRDKLLSNRLNPARTSPQKTSNEGAAGKEAAGR
jgi:hypothetical protein